MFPCRPRFIIIVNENVIVPFLKPNKVIQLRFLFFFFIPMLPVRKRIVSLSALDHVDDTLQLNSFMKEHHEKIVFSWILFTSPPTQRGP